MDLTLAICEYFIINFLLVVKKASMEINNEDYNRTRRRNKKKKISETLLTIIVKLAIFIDKDKQYLQEKA